MITRIDTNALRLHSDGDLARLGPITRILEHIRVLRDRRRLVIVRDDFLDVNRRVFCRRTGGPSRVSIRPMVEDHVRGMGRGILFWGRQELSVKSHFGVFRGVARGCSRKPGD